MKIAINALSAVTGGTVTYLQNLLPWLGRLDQANQYLVLGTAEQLARLLPARKDAAGLRPWPVAPPAGAAARVAWEQTALVALLRRAGVDLLYAPSNVCTLLAPCKVVVGERNMNLAGRLGLRYGTGSGVRNYLESTLARWSARRADLVIFVSHGSCDYMAERWRLPLAKTRVVYHGRSEIFRPLNGGAGGQGDPRFGGSYILSVSAIFKHKNYPALLRAYAELRRRGYAQHLVIAGKPVDGEEVAHLRQLAHEAGLASDLHMLAEVPYEELPGLYARASLFVFPSLHEVFGHPLVEAMASGVPVVCSNAVAMPEICQDAALYFDPSRPDELAQAAAAVLNNAALGREMAIRGIERAQDFSWERTARESLSVFGEAVEGGILHS